MVVLRELSEPDAEAFVVASIASFVDDLAANDVDRRAATEATDEFLRQLLPDGVRTTGHRFRAILIEDAQVGSLWFGPVPASAADWFLYEITIDEDVRGRSIGRAALELVIDELNGSNAERLGLNVFESNTVALALYERLGFEVGRASDSGLEMWLRLRSVASHRSPTT